MYSALLEFKVIGKLIIAERKIKEALHWFVTFSILRIYTYNIMKKRQTCQRETQKLVFPTS